MTSGGNGLGPEGGGGDLIDLSTVAAERLADIDSTIIRDRPAWVASVSTRIAADATALLVREPELPLAHAVLIASGESPPVSLAPGRPECSRCGTNLDVDGTCAIALDGECPQGREAPRGTL